MAEARLIWSKPREVKPSGDAFEIRDSICLDLDDRRCAGSMMSGKAKGRLQPLAETQVPTSHRDLPDAPRRRRMHDAGHSPEETVMTKNAAAQLRSPEPKS